MNVRRLWMFDTAGGFPSEGGRVYIHACEKDMPTFGKWAHLPFSKWKLQPVFIHWTAADSFWMWKGVRSKVPRNVPQQLIWKKNAHYDMFWWHERSCSYVHEKHCSGSEGKIIRSDWHWWFIFPFNLETYLNWQDRILILTYEVLLFSTPLAVSMTARPTITVKSRGMKIVSFLHLTLSASLKSSRTNPIRL